MSIGNHGSEGKIGRFIYFHSQGYFRAFEPGWHGVQGKPMLCHIVYRDYIREYKTIYNKDHADDMWG
ncbi:TPA: hypothetical protein HA265_04100 [Candidatus Woesearchaeota archaeon]|nr:hypothetical protein [Candidatus Woesearchaeota archaeon]